MNEVKIKIKLPEDITVHIPSFKELDLEDVMRVVATEGVRLVKRIVQERVIDAFIEKHEPYMQAMVKTLLEKHEEDIKKILNTNNE